MERVVVKRCDSYQETALYTGVSQLLDLLGGLESFISPGQKVLLKVNLLMGKPPETAVTTHPVLVKVITRLVQAAGGKVIIGDSPGGPFTESTLKKIYSKSGLTDIAVETGAELNYNIGKSRISFPEGRVGKSFVLGDFVTEADVIINLPKLKTHGMTMYTGAVKNLFGTIPGLLKAEYHLKMPQIDMFTEMLIDLALLIKPSLNIFDAITGMEGEGPSSGLAKDFGYLMASPSPFALDVAGINLMGISPGSVPLIEGLKKREITADISNLQLVGDELLPREDVEIPVIEQASNLLDRKMPRPVSNFLSWLLRPRPVFDHDKCVGCGDCSLNCPAGIIDMNDNKPSANLADCIRCFCCQELCEYNAVTIKRPLAGRLLFKRAFKQEG